MTDRTKINTLKEIKSVVRFEDFVQPEDLFDYVDDTGADWDVETSQFKLVQVQASLLESAVTRPLLLSQVDISMVGQTYSVGPLILDADLSVIDGMHRLADNISLFDGNTNFILRAYVRIED
jgi:hypothetical protein